MEKRQIKDTVILQLSSCVSDRDILDVDLEEKFSGRKEFDVCGLKSLAIF